MESKLIALDNSNTFLPETLNDSFLVYEDCQDPVSQWVDNNHLLYEHTIMHLIKPLL